MGGAGSGVMKAGMLEVGEGRGTRWELGGGVSSERLKTRIFGSMKSSDKGSRSWRQRWEEAPRKSVDPPMTNVRSSDGERPQNRVDAWRTHTETDWPKMVSWVVGMEEERLA